ncbi:TPA: hypothetical protein HA273_06910, partial [Candidatus Bathyarchaeota archaeon]|nr:hypothetical protein [Candidatus Bathyarchaeota archaeon]
EFLLRKSFVDQVLHGGVHVSSVIMLDDFLRKLGEKGSWNAVEGQVYEQVVFNCQDLCFPFHGLSLGAHAYVGNRIKKQVPQRPLRAGERA